MEGWFLLAAAIVSALASVGASVGAVWVRNRVRKDSGLPTDLEGEALTTYQRLNDALDAEVEARTRAEKACEDELVKTRRELGTVLRHLDRVMAQNARLLLLIPDDMQPNGSEDDSGTTH